MADYIAHGRSNYFKVKDDDAFEKWCKELELEVITQEDKVGFVVNTDHGDLPSWRFPEDGEDEEVDVVKELAEHLVEGQVAIIMESGAEKMCYIGGFAIAVNSEGETKEIYLSEIFNLAKELGPEVTPCEG